jgi:hypothetical protein
MSTLTISITHVSDETGLHQHFFAAGDESVCVMIVPLDVAETALPLPEISLARRNGDTPRLSAVFAERDEEGIVRLALACPCGEPHPLKAAPVRALLGHASVDRAVVAAVCIGRARWPEWEGLIFPELPAAEVLALGVSADA